MINASSNATTRPRSTLSVAMTVNGRATGPHEIPEDLMLLEFLQETLNLTGTRYACGQGVCRACAVIIDGDDGPEVVPACITGAVWCDGRSIRTVEDHARRNDDGEVIELSPVQQAFLDHFSFQCSYCAPGFVNAATALIERLERSPISRDQVEAAVLDALNPNICRCTGYVRYLSAIRDLILETPGLTSTSASEAHHAPPSGAR